MPDQHAVNALVYRCLKHGKFVIIKLFKRGIKHRKLAVRIGNRCAVTGIVLSKALYSAVFKPSYSRLGMGYGYIGVASEHALFQERT